MIMKGGQSPESEGIIAVDASDFFNVMVACCNGLWGRAWVWREKQDGTQMMWFGGGVA